MNGLPEGNTSNRMYGGLAWAWPVISPPDEYDEEAGDFAEAILRFTPAARTLLDLGCGGGHNDFHLKERFEVTGVDLSEEMLALASRLNPSVRYHQGDMRSLRLGETFDTVIVADSIDYMLTEEDLRAAFTTAYAHLNPGGVFVTYVEWSRETFEQNWTYTSVNRGERVEIVLVHNQYDPDPADSTFEATFVYLIRREGVLSVETDRHLLGLFDFVTWLRLLDEVGFQVHVIDKDEAAPLLVGVKP